MYGQYRHTLDAKGRLFVPSKLRDELGASFYIAKAPDGCLAVYPEQEWQRVLEHSNSLPFSQARAMRVFFAGALPPAGFLPRVRRHHAGGRVHRLSGPG